MARKTKEDRTANGIAGSHYWRLAANAMRRLTQTKTKERGLPGEIRKARSLLEIRLAWKIEGRIKRRSVLIHS